MSHRRPQRTRFRATFFLLLYLPACTSWQVVSVTPEQLIGDQHPWTIRIQQNDGKKLVFDHPEIAGDSIVGLVPMQRALSSTDTRVLGRAEPTRSTDQVPQAVALSDVHQVATQHADAGKSVLAGLGFATALLAIVAIAALDTWDGPLGGFGQ
ncbi:MAG: hypothetical protein ABI587_10165 [Gemmatimonadales bacterium]